jgi:TetR/AcrR family transcriptional repressor of nem operon
VHLRERSRRSPEEREEQILDAAERTLLANGLPSTTVADVADAAGVAKGTVYLYFDSKAELLTALRSRYTRRFLDTLGDALDDRESTDFGARLDAFVRSLLEFSLAHHELHHVLFHEAGVRERHPFAALRQLLEGFIAAGTGAGAFVPVEPAIAADFLLQGLHGALAPMLHGKRELGPPLETTMLLARRLLMAT